MHYKVSFKNPNRHYIDISCMIEDLKGESVELTFPAWRPGRYELGNFAKNIQKIEVFNTEGKRLDFKKTSKNSWSVKLNGAKAIRIDYNYFAFELNAGSTYLDETQLYINPVNCFIYDQTKQLEICTVVLDIPEDYKIASGLKFEENRLQTKSYHQLVDNPFIASNSLKHYEFECEGVQFHLWFQGECKINWPKVKADFMAYTKHQIRAFGAFPVSEYHYLYQITPYRTYHGVEHLNSTVIALGPCYDLMDGLYADFLGVSSHELYHAFRGFILATIWCIYNRRLR